MCEKNCKYNGYNLNTKKVLCECAIKTKFSLISEIISNKNELLFNLVYYEENSEFGSEIYSQDNDNYSFTEGFFNYAFMSNNTINEKLKIINIFREELKEGILDNLINNTILIKKEDLLRKENDILYQVTSTENQNKNYYLNISVIKLKQCEFRLKSFYNISQNESLIILKIDNFIEEMNIPYVEYEIYHPYTKKALNLEICNESSIEISYPVTINENEIYKYDPKSAYYNDKCFPYTTENGTDITLNDRKNEYNKNNISLCNINCTFSEYNKDNKRAYCECKPKTFFEELFYIKINKDKLFHKFTDFKSNTNFKVIFCYESFFCVNGIKTNIGSYILIVIIIINGIGALIFYTHEYKKIKKIILNLFNSNNNEDTKKGNKNIIKVGSNKENININDIFNINKINKKEKSKENNYNHIKNNKLNNNINNSNLPNINDSKNKFEIYKENNIKNIGINNKKIEKNKYKGIIPNIKNDYIDKEINTLKYEEALKLDKRSYIQYYQSLIKTKHLLIFSFITKNDYNSRIIKICLFFFSFALLYTINSFFFQDPKIRKIYEEKGTFNFIYEIPQIIYSTIISGLVTILIKYLSLSDNIIIYFKKNKNIENCIKTIKCLRVKFIIFYILEFLFLLLFWYYIGCFCAVFKNTQLYFIEDTFISFLLSLIYPFILNLIPGIFRIAALKNRKKCLYVMSKIIQLI